MLKLKQNNLAEGTSNEGFLEVVNTDKGAGTVYLQKEVTLASGETVIVEGMQPDKLKEALNNTGATEIITYKTPGEYYNDDIKGVVRTFNDNNEEPAGLPTVETGKTYKITFKNTIPELEDIDYLEEIMEVLHKTYISVSDESDMVIGVSELPLAPISNTDSANYSPVVVGGPGGWSVDGETLVEIVNPYTITIGYIRKDSETGISSLDMTPFAFMITSIEEIEE